MVAQGGFTVNSLTLSGAAKLTVKANEIPTDKYDEVFCDEATTLDAQRAAAAVVQIAGDFTVGDTAVVYPEAAILTGVPVIFKVGGDFTVAEGASFNTRKLGWGWSGDLWESRPSEYCKPMRRESNDPEIYGWTLAIGAGRSWGLGGKYGGTEVGDTWQGKRYGKSYGPAFAPLFSGSPAGAYKDLQNTTGKPEDGKKINPDASRGPGSIVVLASGKAKIDGVMDADGSRHVAGEVYEHSGSSGGGIWLAAQNFAFGPNAKLTAIGGDKVASPYANGGGGRIALAIGCSQDELDTLFSGELPEGATLVEEVAGVTADVRGGARPDGSAKVIDGTAVTVRSAHTPVELTLDVFGDGAVKYDGESYVEPTVIVVPTLTDLTLKAVPGEGRRFISWSGACLPGGYSTDSEITINLTVPARIIVNFSGEKVSRVWTGPAGGNWNDGLNWTPIGIPSEEDDLYVTNASPLVTGPIACHDLVIAGNSKVTFQAETAAGADPVSFDEIYAGATVVRISGDFEVADTATVTAVNDPKTGVAVKFEVGGDFTLSEEARFTADGKGWYWQTGTDDPHKTHVQGDDASGYWQTRAPGAGGESTSAGAYLRGGGYGGAAGSASGIWGQPYGFANAPFLPGSPNGLYQWKLSNATHPGGTIWLHCAGMASIGGQVTADALKEGGFGTASGGGIWLTASDFAFGPNAKLSAHGGDSTNDSYTDGGSGGRISLGLGLSGDEIAALAAGEEEVSGVRTYESIPVVATEVRGGLHANGSSNGASPGTTTLVVGSACAAIAVDGAPLQARGTSPQYGIYGYAPGGAVTLTAEQYGYDPSSDSVRYALDGYSLDGGETVAGRSVGLTATETLQTLTWKWGAPQPSALIRMPEHATMTVNGVEATGDTSVWVEPGVRTEVTVTPDAGYEFLNWIGDVPFGAEDVNPVSFAFTRSSTVTPVVRLAEEPTTRTWGGGTGSWNDPEAWTPKGNIPGSGDDVVIAGGTCNVPNYLAAKSLTVSGGTLNVGAEKANSARLAVSGDVAVSGGTVKFGVEDHDGHFRADIGGDLALSGAAKLYVYGGLIEGEYTHATGASWVNVGGALTLDGTSTVYPVSSRYTGGSVVFRAEAVSVGESATVNADEAGYRWLDGDTPPLATGIGYTFSQGASYGGLGKGAAVTKKYGFANAPIEPGSPNGNHNQSFDNCYNPGGLIRIHARTMSVAGTLTASAKDGSLTFGGPSGGGIWLTADSFDFAATAVLAAHGGQSNYNYSMGGGGRIAVSTGLTEAQYDGLAADGKIRRKVYDVDVFTNAFPGVAVDVRGGAFNADATQRAEDGTFTYLPEPPGLMLLVK